MNTDDSRAGVGRRAFLKMSAAAVGGAAGFPQSGEAETAIESEFIHPFTIEVPDAVLTDLRERLARTRFPGQLDEAGWDYGTELSYLKELCAYWRTGFDWHDQERALNRFDHFRSDIDGLKIHFIHQRSREKDALPLMVIHGWPSSFVEFTKIIGPLTDPVAHGSRAADAFHVICPSLPGYGFSEAPRQTGFGPSQMAHTFVKLMARLGYSRYGAQGGDWGAVVSAWMAGLDAPRVVGLHMNSTLANPPAGEQAQAAEAPPSREESGPNEKQPAEDLGSGYAAIQSTKPQSLGYGLNDSPCGLAAWIVEKFRSWSDCGGNVESRFTKDELLTNIMVYWVTQTITSSMRLYYEARASGWKLLPDEKITVPTGCALFKTEPQLPRSWVERSFHVARWTVLPSGGHFTALEEPGLLVDDIRAFFRDLR